MNTFFDKMPESLRLSIKSSLPLIIVIVLFLVVGNFGIGKIVDLQTQVSSGQNNLNVLKNKLSILQNISSDVLASGDISLAAVPEDNPSLAVVSQIRTISSQNTLSVSNIKTGGEVQDSSGLSRVDISFEVEGARVQVFTFLDAIEKIAPITLIDKVKISEVSGVDRAQVNVKSYWSNLPSTIPALTESVSDLTESEKTVLTDINGLTLPAFVSLSPSVTPGKTDPFGQ